MKKILFTVLMFCSVHLLSAQEVKSDTILSVDLINDIIELMPDSTVHIANPYKELEPQFLADIDWLNNTPLNDRRKDLREEKNRFVLMWMSGCPYISINIDDRVMKFTGAAPWTLLYYMIGWTKYSLEQQSTALTGEFTSQEAQELVNVLKYSTKEDILQCTIAGITNAVRFYQLNRDFISKNKEMEKFSVMIDNGTLEEYVKSMMEL